MAFWRSLRYRWARLRSLWRRWWRLMDARLFQLLHDRRGKGEKKDS
jgi:hypothetical protein